MPSVQLSVTSASQASPLERCINQAEDNRACIHNITSRVNALIDRINGPRPPAPGHTGTTEKALAQGLLNEHLVDLEFEGAMLGSLQADLAELERLL